MYIFLFAIGLLIKTFFPQWLNKATEPGKIRFVDRTQSPLLLLNLFINAWLMVLTTSYTLVSDKTMELFSCVKQNDGTYSIANSPDLLCYTDEWYSKLPWAIVSIVVYCLGIPAFFLFLVFKYREEIKHHDLKLRDRIGSTYMRYRTRHFYWEVFIFVRKFGIVGARTLT